MPENNFLTVKEIARAALPILADNIVMPALVTREFDGEFSGKLGDTVQIRKPEIKEAKEFISQIDPQAIDEKSVDIKLDKIADVSYEVTSKELTLNINNFNEQITTPAMKGLAEKINKDGLALYKDVPYYVGDAGTDPAKLTDIKNARVALNKMKVPVSDRYCVWDPEADGNLSILDPLLNSKATEQATAALQEGLIGRVGGFNHYMSQAVYEHKAGGYAKATGVKVTTAASKGAKSISLTATSGTGKLVKGDVIVIGGYQYVVTEDTTEAASNAISGVLIYPVLQADVAQSAAVTILGDHTANLAFQKFAFGFATVPLELPQDADAYVASDPDTGISVRVVRAYDINTKKQIISFDVLYGYKTLYPQLAVRAFGSNA